APADELAAEPARDLDEALARVRRRIVQLRSGGVRTCLDCAAPLGSDDTGVRCAPCAGATRRARRLALERLLFEMPWLRLEEARELLGSVAPGEFEGTRIRLLARWRSQLERARRAGRLSASGLERRVASSYVLLQSRLPPERIGREVVRNALGAELDELLWGAAARASNERR
ncbi:MAG: hypothetical protein ACREM2_09720, partial [Vulcanimicrobiaceae bacterium]